MELAKANKMRSIAFPAISTGIFNFPLEEATKIAISSILDWLNKIENFDSIDKVVFCLNSARTKKIYENNLDFFK